MIRPSTRMIRVWYYISFTLIAIVFFYINNRQELPESANYAFAIPLLLIAVTIWKHLQLRFITLTVIGNKLRYEKGFLSKSTRAMELSKVQDVSVSQTLTQRLLGVGDISVETAGDSSALAMKNVDRPQAVADFILESARG